MRSFGFIMVDGSAHRFLAEPAVEHHAAGNALIVRDFRSGEFTRLPSYLVFDDATRRAGPIVTNEAGANRVLSWSESNLEEVGQGWIKRQRLGRPPRPRTEPAALARRTPCGNITVPPSKALTSSAAAGRDGAVAGTPLLRHSRLAGAFQHPGRSPPGSGWRGDRYRRHAIPGLFSAGELGSIWGALYPGAGNVTEAVVFGRIAGRSAAT